MSEDEALAQLRDIHLPADIAMAAPIQFALWPFLALAAAATLLLAIRLWNRSYRRRQRLADLARIARTEDASAQWSMLLDLATRLPARTGQKPALPSLAYRRPETITEAERAAFIQFIGAELRR